MRNRATLIAGLSLLLGAAYWNGDSLQRWLSPDAVQAAVAGAGAWGPALYVVLAMASFTVFLLSPVVWVATALWPVPWAFAYSFVAALLASLLTYGLTFVLGREWARARVPASISQWEARLEARPIWALVLIRFWLWANPLVDMLVAVSSVPPRAYVLGTLLGLLWPTAFQIGLGAGGGALLSSVEIPLWGWAVIAVIVAAGGAVLWSRRRAPAEAEEMSGGGL